MGAIVNVHEAETHLSRLLDRVSQGEEIIIAKSGKPVARLVAVTEHPQQRTPGSALGQVAVAPDFDAPLPEDGTIVSTVRLRIKFLNIAVAAVSSLLLVMLVGYAFLENFTPQH